MTLPFWTSYLLRVFSWKIILGFNGVINSGLKSVGLIEQPMEFLLYSPSAVVITLTHAWAAFAVLPLYVSLEKIDRSLLEAATDLGEGPVGRFMRVTLPLSLPGIIAAILIIFIPTVGDYITPALLGGPRRDHDRQHDPGPVRQGEQLADGSCTRRDHDDLGRHLLGGLHVRYTCTDRANRMSDVSYINRPNRPLSFYAVFYLAFLYVPVLFLPLFSFNDSIYVAFPLKGYTTKWYGQLFDNEPLLAALMNSVKVGAVSAVIATTLGIFAAKAVTRYRMPGRGPVIGFIMLPLVVPGIIFGVALLILMSRLGVPLSLYTVTIGHVIVCVPFAMATLIPRFEGFDKSIEEAAADLGENAWGTFWRVTLPIVFPGVVASLLLSFTISFDEFIMAFFLTGTDPTLPVYIWGQLRFPNRIPGVLALGSIVLVASFIVVFFSQWLTNRGTQPKLVGKV